MEAIRQVIASGARVIRYALQRWRIFLLLVVDGFCFSDELRGLGGRGCLGFN
jgi:hypothetical protein